MRGLMLILCTIALALVVSLSGCKQKGDETDAVSTEDADAQAKAKIMQSVPADVKAGGPGASPMEAPGD